MSKKEAGSTASFFAYFLRNSCKIPFDSPLFYIIYILDEKGEGYASLQEAASGIGMPERRLTDCFFERMNMSINGINMHLFEKKRHIEKINKCVDCQPKNQYQDFLPFCSQKVHKISSKK